MAIILGILALITASKCWINKWKHISSQYKKFKSIWLEACHSSKMPSPATEAWQDTLHPFYVPSDHIQDYSQSTLFLCVLLRAYQHSCWYQLVSDWQFQPRGVVSDIASLQVPRIPWREELLVLHTWRMRKKNWKVPYINSIGTLVHQIKLC